MPQELKAPNIIKVVMDEVSAELEQIKESEPEVFGRFSIVITNEQQFVKASDAKPNTIFIVVKFLQGSRDNGQQRQPISISAFGEHDSVRACQKLMMDFAETNNLKYTSKSATSDTKGYFIRQTISTVAAASNFAEAFNGFRSLFYVTGTFLIGINGYPIASIAIASNAQGTDAEEIEFLSAQWSYNTQQDSQAFYDTNNFSRTINKIASLSIGFTMYASDTPFMDSVMNTVFDPNGNADIDKKHYLVIRMKSKQSTPYIVPMRMVSVSGVQEIRDFPAVSITFAR